jgi:putative membrane protein
MLRITLAVLHLLAFGVLIFGILTRALALRVPVSRDSLRRAFVGDTLWGAAAAVLVATGLWRLLGSVEKATAYYTHDLFFMAKIGLLVLILLLEVGPIITLTQARAALRRGAAPEEAITAPMARLIATISWIQVALVTGMVVAATSMARGFGLM